MMTTSVIFLPGSLCDERVFADQLRQIDQPCEIVDLTLDDSITAMATRVLREAPPRFVLVGLSLGGIVAAEIARLACESVQAMALVDTNLDATDDAQLRTRRRWATDVQVSMRTDRLDENPFLRNLFPLIKSSILDISFLQVDQTDGDGSQAHVAELATGWMTDNADAVAGWIAEAAAAG